MHAGPPKTAAASLMLADRNGVALEESLTSSIAFRSLRNFAVPAGVLATALLMTGHGPDLKGPFQALQAYGPYLVLALGALLSLAYKRGRALFVMLSLGAAYLSFRLVVQHGTESFAARTAFGAICLFVPLNVALYALIRERGALNAYGVRRLALIVFECLLTAIVIFDGYRLITDAVYQPLFGSALFADPRVPQLALLAMALAVAVATTCAIRSGSVIDAAFAGATVAFAVACNAVSSPEAFAVYFAAAGVMIAAAVVQDSYRMAFQDELTGLPGRRALNERLMSLVGQYTIAMVDVDFFKAFNDRWGHDVGDQVLKLVASRLQNFVRGGQAYRYGGEEFTLLFPGKRLEDVLPRLEQLKRDIGMYRFLMREGHRIKDEKPGAASPAEYGTRTFICVTVSIGVAERDEQLTTPEAVLKASDRALYRAKAGGRNRVSS